MRDAGLGLPAGANVMTLPHFTLESGLVLVDVPVAYSTYGRLNNDGTNGVVVGHSLTSNSNVHEWWGPMMGFGREFTMNLDEEFVVCVNYLGSCYGTASPISLDPATNRPYGPNFPTPCTIRDNVFLQRKVCDLLGVTHLKLAIGGSMGSMVALEWAASFPNFVDELILIAGCGRHGDWAIAIGEAERFAIYADQRYMGGAYLQNDPPAAGLAAARMTAMLTYRAPRSVDDRHDRAGSASTSEIIETELAELEELGIPPKAVSEKLRKTLPRYDVESYLRYQGRKFAKRFDPNCYVQLTHTLDTHDVARGRNGNGDGNANGNGNGNANGNGNGNGNGNEKNTSTNAYHKTLRSLTQKTLVVGITSDFLYPTHLQQEMADNMPRATMFVIDSKHGTGLSHLTRSAFVIAHTRPFRKDGRYDQKGALPRTVTLPCLRNTNPGYTRHDRLTLFVYQSGHDAFLIEIAALNKRAAAFRGDEGKSTCCISQIPLTVFPHKTDTFFYLSQFLTKIFPTRRTPLTRCTVRLTKTSSRRYGLL